MNLFGAPYDEQLYLYIQGIRYPSDWRPMFEIVKPISDIKTLYRGTDYSGFLNLGVSDTLDFTNRFYSWTDKYSIANSMYMDGVVIVWQQPSPIAAIDLRTANRSQSEILVPPVTLVIECVSQNNEEKKIYHARV
jgi:hypothetical protein